MPNFNPATAPHTAHSTPAISTTTRVAWKDCNVSKMVRKAIRRKHGPTVVETVVWVDDVIPYLEWVAPGLCMTAMRRPSGALEIEEHEA